MFGEQQFCMAKRDWLNTYLNASTRDSVYRQEQILKQQALHAKRQREMKAYVYNVSEACDYLKSITPPDVKTFVYQEFYKKTKERLVACKDELDEFEDKDRAAQCLQEWENLVTESDIAAFSNSKLLQLREQRVAYADHLRSNPKVVANPKHFTILASILVGMGALSLIITLTKLPSLTEDNLKTLASCGVVIAGGIAWILYLRSTKAGYQKYLAVKAAHTDGISNHAYVALEKQLLGENPSIQQHIKKLEQKIG